MERNIRRSMEAFQRLSQKSVPVFLVICLPYLLSATIVGSEALALNQVQGGSPWKGVIRWSRETSDQSNTRCCSNDYCGEV